MGIGGGCACQIYTYTLFPTTACAATLTLARNTNHSSQNVKRGTGARRYLMGLPEEVRLVSSCDGENMRACKEF